jgi:hypothetical protein
MRWREAFGAKTFGAETFGAKTFGAKTFGALGRFSAAAFRRRVLGDLPPALERRCIATPMA